MSWGERLFASGPNPSVMTITCMSMRLEPSVHLFSFSHHQKQTGSLAWGRQGQEVTTVLRFYSPATL